jgi:hypothetical protein
MKPRLLAGPLILLLWQTAPVSVQYDSIGRYRLSFGYGAGQYEYRSLDCSGNVVSSRPVDYHTAGAQLDVWPSDRWRLSGFGGYLSDSPYGGFLLANEDQKVGIGAGIVRIPNGVGDWGSEGPSLYLRLGSIDNLHFRADVLSPSPVFGTTGWLRLGLGFNQGHLRGVGGLFGLGVGPYSDESHLGGPFGELWIPVNNAFDLTLHGAWRPSASYADWSWGIGGRYSFGR